MLCNAAGRVQAPHHVSPTKASLSTGGLVGGLGLMAGDFTSWLPPLLGLEPLLPQLGAVEAITLAALAASGAGVRAQGVDGGLRRCGMLPPGSLGLDPSRLL